MDDDERLATLFAAAASEAGAPPTAFDHGDVLAASRRITVRRRTAFITSGLAVFALLGIGSAVLPGYTQQPDATSAAAPAVAPEAASGSDQADAPAGPGSGGSELSEGLRSAPTDVAPPGSGTGVCADRQDRALRALLEQVIPEVSGARPGAVTDICLPGGQRYVTLEVDDTGVAGLLVVSYLPPGTVADAVAGELTAPTASGGTVIVSSRPAQPGGPVPFEARLDTAAAYLAARL